MVGDWFDAVAAENAILSGNLEEALLSAQRVAAQGLLAPVRMCAYSPQMAEDRQPSGRTKCRPRKRTVARS